MNRVILVRHGQTEWNRADRFRGRADVTLNTIGQAQAAAIADYLKDSCSISSIYSSPLTRALDTAAPIAGAFGLKIQPVEELTDIDYGQWQGLTPDEVSVRWPELCSLWYSQPQRVEIPGGESLAALRKRAVAGLSQVLSRHQDEAVALVSHQAVCRVLLLYALGLDNDAFWHIQQENGAINVLTSTERGFTVWLVNHTCHLGAL
ncbi:MAG: histidine phosphatase family protein [Chloroflexi bacterium]|nr:histidine phosphatase family protein [Chloroflexota bacterium]